MEPREEGAAAPSAGRAFDRAMAGLTGQQRIGVTTPSPALCILAGAGSGKTRVLTLRVARRIRDGSADADHSIVCTFTRRAAHELRDRLARYGVAVSVPAPRGGAPSPGVRAGTTHQLALTLLRRRARDTGAPPPTICAERYRLVRHRVANSELASALATEIGWAKARGLTPDGYAAGALRAGREAVVAPDQVQEAFAAYQAALARRRAVDLDDLLVLATDALESDHEFGERARWRYRHLSVDEFQDVNPAQYRLIRAVAGDRLDLCVVGDPNQAIYGWNGADPTLLHRLPGEVTAMEVLRLDENHRSSPQVVAAAVEALGPEALLVPRSAAVAGPQPVVSAYDDEDAEVEGVASLILDSSDAGRPWSDHAVLARTNEQLLAVGRALARAGVPCRSAAGVGERDPAGRQGAATTGSGDPGTGDLAGGADRVTAEMGPTEDGDLTEDLDVADGGGGRRNRGRDGTGAPGRNAVELATFHRAKGLEWDTVFVIGLEEGFVPISYASAAEARAEERRLLYVALTRASRQLHCSWARRRRTTAGRRRERDPSPWLAAVSKVSRAGTGRPAPGHAGRRIAELRAALGR